MEIIVNDTRSTKDKIRDKISEIKTAVSNRANEALRWTADHSGEIVQALPVVIGAATGTVKLIKLVRGSAQDRHEDRMDKCYYDPSTGLHWELERNMTNAERTELVQRKRAGEYTEDILRDMRILK